MSTRDRRVLVLTEDYYPDGAAASGRIMTEMAEDMAGCQEKCRTNREIPDATRQLVEKVSPDFAIHLAGQSSVGSSWADERRTISANVGSSVNLLNALSCTAPTRIFPISSGEVYGHIVRPARVVAASAFNHTGPGRPPKCQRYRHAIPAFAEHWKRRGSVQSVQWSGMAVE